MIKTLQKGAILMALFGLLMVAAAPSAMAQGRNKCRTRSNSYAANNYYNDDYRRDATYERSRRNRDRDYYDREDTTGNAVKRTAIGAGIGALGGAVIGGKKGAAIGAGIGAAGGYIYHRKKVGDERDRRYRY
ncbi:MAG: YMGG-like glycine zipper-containing protein [Blastocatellia bacterium]